MTTRNANAGLVPARFRNLSDLNIERRDKRDNGRKIVDFPCFLNSIRAYVDDEDEAVERLLKGQFIETGWAYFRIRARESVQELLADARILRTRSDAFNLRQRLLLADRERELRPLTAVLDSVIHRQRWYVEQLKPGQEKVIAEKFLAGWRNSFPIKLGKEPPDDAGIATAAYLRDEGKGDPS
jgi:hypothetical protein